MGKRGWRMGKETSKDKESRHILRAKVSLEDFKCGSNIVHQFCIFNFIFSLNTF